MARSKRKLPQVLHAPVYLALRGAMTALGAMPPEASIPAARSAARAFANAPFNRGRLARAHDHLAIAYPEWTPAQRHAMAVRAYEHLFVLAVETIVMQPRLNASGWPGLIEFGDIGPAVRRLTSGEPCIMLTAHCGNWELLGSSLALLGFPSHALYRPLDLKPLDAYLRRSRQRLGMQLVDKFGAGDDVAELMTRGGTPAFVGDQNAGVKGQFVPFFGRLAATYKSLALLAQTYRAHLLIGAARRLAPEEIAPADAARGPIRYRIEVFDTFGPEDYARRPDPAFYITARYRRGIETAVRRSPEQFLWMHRYWRSRPRFEQAGRPFPAALRRKLEELPWMTPGELERIMTHSAADTAACRANAPATPDPAESHADPEPTPPAAPAGLAGVAEPHLVDRAG